MKLSYFISLMIVAVVAQQHEASPVESVIRDGLVALLLKANSELATLENKAKDYLAEKLQNYTNLKEWSVDIQTGVATGIAKKAFEIFEDYKAFVEALSPTKSETKILNCLSKEEPNILASIENATSTNGWCNNRMAPNLTLAFQEVITALLKMNAQFQSYDKSLKSCLLGDDLCVTEYAVKVVALLKNDVLDSSSDLRKGLSDVYAIYKIMFGQDVPACNKKYLFPILSEGVKTSTASISSCISS